MYELIKHFWYNWFSFVLWILQKIPWLSINGCDAEHTTSNPIRFNQIQPNKAVCNKKDSKPLNGGSREWNNTSLANKIHYHRKIFHRTRNTCLDCKIDCFSGWKLCVHTIYRWAWARTRSFGWQYLLVCAREHAYTIFKLHYIHTEWMDGWVDMVTLNACMAERRNEYQHEP